MALGISERVQVSLGGLVFNADESTDAEGCYWVTSLNGWTSRSAKMQRYPKPASPGSYRVPSYTAERIVVLDGYCIAPSEEARSRAESRLAAMASNPQTLYRMDVSEEMGSTFRLVEVESVDIVRETEFVVHYVVQVAAPDPHRYAATTLSTSAGLPADAASGLDWTDPTGLDWTDPTGLSWGVPLATGKLTITNNGTAGAWPTFTISAGAADLVNPTITYLATGAALRYGGTLLAGDVLVIVTNPFGRSVTINGSGDRRPSLTRAEWFSAPAGQMSAVSFTADVYSASALLSAEWQSTYF